MHLELLYQILLSYLIGSIPFGLIFVRLFNKTDVRLHGSGNIGATNVVRVGGKLIGGLTLVCDGLKGIVAIYASNIIYDVNPLIIGFVAVYGHIFSIFLSFKGGKGIATYVGVILYVEPIIGLLFLSAWAVLFGLYKISSLSALVAVTISTIALLCTYRNNYEVFAILSVYFFILYKHYPNIQRIIAGQEKGF